MPILTRKTRDYRLQAMRNLMKEAQVDALVLTSADFFQWATNFHAN